MKTIGSSGLGLASGGKPETPDPIRQTRAKRAIPPIGMKRRSARPDNPQLKDDMFNKLSESISHLARELCELVQQRKQEFEWHKSHCDLMTKTDLREMENRMALKVSDLKAEVAGLRSQVVKVFAEQQVAYDALKKSFDDFVASVGNADLPADATQELADFKAELQAFDDRIPDTQA